MKMTVSRDKPVAADAVVVLAGRGMLEMDLGQALAEAGFTMMQGFPRGGLAQALIVDPVVITSSMTSTAFPFT